LASNPPIWILGAAAGAGAAVPAVALSAAWRLVSASWERAGSGQWPRVRWVTYAALGALAAATVGPYLVILLLGCGLVEVAVQFRGSPSGPRRALIATAVAPTMALSGLGALGWVAFKVGVLSYGGGFVIVPLMQHDAVVTYHWMSGAQFLNAVALGQVTPGPVVQTVAVVGYAAGGVGGGLLAAAVAFAPSFLFVIFGAPRFDVIRVNRAVSAFLSGAGPTVIGAIAGSAIPLGLALQEPWQVPLLAGAAVWLLVVRRGVVSGLLLAGSVGIAIALVGAPV